MIVVTSNWAIGDGTLFPARSPALGSLVPAIHRAVVRAGVRSDGGYRPVGRVDLVLAGDTFDWLLSAEWLGDVKPWHFSAASREVASQIARRSLHCGRATLLPLFRWARLGVDVPTARHSGRTIAVPTRITLLTGDRDELAEELLEAHRDSMAVGRRWDDGRVTIRHGHEFDPVCAPVRAETACRRERPPTLAESVVVDLVARFAAAIGPDGRTLVGRIASAGVVGIPGRMAAWHDRQSSGLRVRLGNAWHRAVDEWWRRAQRCVPTVETQFDAVDAVAAWFRTVTTEHGPVDPQAAGLSGLLAGHVPGAIGTVFGHVEGDGAAGSPLGLAGEARVVACRTARGWPRWESIVGHDADPAVVTIRHPGEHLPGGDRVIDAA